MPFSVGRGKPDDQSKSVEELGLQETGLPASRGTGGGKPHYISRECLKTLPPPPPHTHTQIKGVKLSCYCIGLIRFGVRPVKQRPL